MRERVKRERESDKARDEPDIAINEPDIAINTGNKRVAYSMDAVALYPSIKAKMAGEAVKRAMENTTVTFANVSYAMALRYIAKDAKDDKEVEEWGMSEWCPVRTKDKGKRPGVTGAKVVDAKWTEANVPYDGPSRRKILGKVLELAVITVYRSNVYRFAGKTYLQQDGSPIGLDLSGEIGRLVMAQFDMDFMDRCEKSRIHVDLNQRYVDDDDLVQPAIPPGYKVGQSGLIEFRKEWEDLDISEGLPDDERTTNVMVSLANQIDPNIVMTGDCPSKHDSGRVPMLDLAIYVEEVDKEVNTDVGLFRIIVEQVSYGFYKKPLASKLILRSSTAIPQKMKYENAANELIRRGLNTMRGMKGFENERRKVTNEFMKTLQLSGYDESFRYQTALSAYKGVEKMIERERAGGRRVYRLQTDGAAARSRQKLLAKTEWFKGRASGDLGEWETEESGRICPTPPSGKGLATPSPTKPGKENLSQKKNKNGQKKDERKCEVVIFVHTL